MSKLKCFKGAERDQRVSGFYMTMKGHSRTNIMLPTLINLFLSTVAVPGAIILIEIVVVCNIIVSS